MSEEIKKETDIQKHLRVVNQIAEIFDQEFDDADDIFFIIRTLRNIFIWDSEDSRTQHLFHNALNKFMNESGTEWFKRSFLSDKRV